MLASGKPSEVTIAVYGDRISLVVIPEVRKALSNSLSVVDLIILTFIQKQQAPTFFRVGLSDLFGSPQIFEILHFPPRWVWLVHLRYRLVSDAYWKDNSIFLC